MGAALGLAGALFLAVPAGAQTSATKITVDAAKQAGLVGEKADGYLGFVRASADPALKAAVDEINAGRAQLYREAAARNNVSPAQAGASAYQQVVRDRVKVGEFYQDAGGAWTSKK